MLNGTLHVKIAIAQLDPTIGDLTGNAQRLLEAAEAAAAQGAQLLLTPELALCGYPPRDLLMHPGFVVAIAHTLEQLATNLPPQLAVLIGTVAPNPNAPADGEKPLFNSVALLHQGKVQQLFHKRLLPTYDVFDEDRYFEPGTAVNHFWLAVEGGQQQQEPAAAGADQAILPSLSSPPSSTSPPSSASPPSSTSPSPHPPIHIGVTICEDLWNDEEFWGQRNYEVNPIADLAALPVDFTVNLSASPYTVGKQHLREQMLKHIATRFEQPILYANQVGGNDDLIFDGSSFALNREGELVCRAAAFSEDLVFVEYDAAKRDLIATETAAIRVSATDRSIAPLPATADAEIWSALVLGVRDYAHKCGFSKAVIGLSGGVDSALVAAIAVTALGHANVLGVLMPSPYSSDHSVNDALQLAENLGIQTQTLSIGELMQGYDHTLENLFAGTDFGLAEENIQSRIRGNLLMAISNKFGYLLLSTGNKSELAVGYCTLYGDMNGGLAVIADVPKTRVYSICDWLNHTHSIPPIPQNILTKPPSAELKPGQVDQDSLPAYEVLDDILERLIHKHQTPQQIEAGGHDAATINKITQLISRAEFKRRQAPPVLKVSDRAFGIGWRMPIANRWLPKVDE